MVGAVAFLMSFIFPSCLQDTDTSDNDADGCHYNTCNTNYCFQRHILYLSRYFPLCTTSTIQEVLKCKHLAKGEPLTVYGNTYIQYNVNEQSCQ